MDKTYFIDTHAHLDDAKYDGDRNDVIARAREAGLKNVISVVCWDKKRAFGSLEKLMKTDGFLYFALGVHPHEAKDAIGSLAFDDMKRLALEHGSRIVAIGECGLDYHYEYSPKDTQQEAFKAQISLARELNLPLIIHSREAEDDTLRIMKAEGAHEIGGVLHCFSGSANMLGEALKMGFYISFTGVVTFPKAAAVKDAVRNTPVEKMLIETDCPYLAPEPNRGKRNEPSYVADTAKAIAGIKGLSVEDIGRITTLNAQDLFGIGTAGTPQERGVKIAYKIRNSIYLNVTNRCSNYCTFCAKWKSYTVKGHYLRLREEPDFRQVLDSITAITDDPTKMDEVVFCGFGEPLLRLDLVKQVGMHLKRMGCRIRIDTDGLANLVHKRNVLPELKFVDCVSVSLNAPDSATYQKLVRTPFGDDAYPAILFFLREAKKHIAKVVASAVTVPGLDVEACRKVAEDDLGVAFRAREYDNVG